MEYFIIKDGKVVELTKEEFEKLEGTPVEKVIKNMTPEELAEFQKTRQENFIKPLMEILINSKIRKRNRRILLERRYKHGSTINKFYCPKIYRRWYRKQRCPS